MGDFKDGIACVKTDDGFFRHIDSMGKFIHKEKFLDLGIYHKSFAIARNKSGWFHIDKLGRPIYEQRYQAIEPFYNGFAVVTDFSLQKSIIDETGNTVLTL